MIKGMVHKYGDNINTDLISPPASMELPIREAAKYAMSNVDPEFAGRVAQGDIFVAGENLGSGSSRETSPLCLKELGISCLIAKSFARIFYRNAINVGLVVVECQETECIEMGDNLTVDYEKGQIVNHTKNESYTCTTIPPHIMGLVDAGGLIPYLKQKLINKKMEETDDETI